MKNKKLLIAILCIFVFDLSGAANRIRQNFDFDWQFRLGENGDFREVQLPHDWSVELDFDEKAGGASGYLPGGIGWYRKSFMIPASYKNQKVSLVFDGIYHKATIFLNGKEIAYHRYGYTSFETDLTPFLKYGESNDLKIKVDHSEISRWYTGSGIYRHVWLQVTNPVHVKMWGTYVTTPEITESQATVKIVTTIENSMELPTTVIVQQRLLDGDGKIVKAEGKEVMARTTLKLDKEKTAEVVQNLLVSHPKLWDLDFPYRYTVETIIKKGGKTIDKYLTPFGIRSVKFDKDKGFFLNNKHLKLKGMCLHQDAGCLGTAVPDRAYERRLLILKEFGTNAIRCSHNPPSPEFLNYCDSIGFLVIDEAFDKWKSGYYEEFFDSSWQQDISDMVIRDRNHPSVFMWSIGNEVPTQCSPVGYKVAKFLQDICHREDPTRPVTCGMDQVTCVLANGFAAMIDIPGLNYRTQRYKESYDQLPQNLILGSETASTVSSRGVYKFPVEDKKSTKYEDHQCSSYDVEACSWSNIPDEDFALADDNHWTIGQFVWTGFDYLGEPSPYDTDAWPNHSSMFGIIDLASLPKDRYYLYRSVWNKDAETLHILPHWTWPGREGEVTPVFVYTNYPTAELFINGKSYGKQSKNNSSLKNRYRLMWMDAVYEPGEVKVVAYNKEGKAVAEKVVRTAGKPHHIELVSNRNELTADGKDLAYVTVKVVDKDGNPCPTDNRQINFSAKGTGKYRAAANGDPTNLEQFHLPKMHAFNGMLTAIIQAGETAGEIVFTAKANGVKAGNIRIQTK